MIMKDFKPAHFSWRVDGTVAHITLPAARTLHTG
jgi:hypothetical protein